MRVVALSRCAAVLLALFVLTLLTTPPAEARTCKHGWPDERCQTVKKSTKTAHARRHSEHARRASVHHRHVNVVWIEQPRRNCPRRYIGYGYEGHNDVGTLARQLEAEGRFGHAI